MSDLQVGLLGIGVAVVAAVYLFNWLQSRKYRREGERAFKRDHQDVLLARSAAVAEGRVEPKLDQAPVPQASASANGGERECSVIDPEIDYVATIDFPHPVEDNAFADVLRRRVEFVKPVFWYGYSALEGAWEEIVPGSGARYGRVQAALQLADRSGPVAEVTLSEFRDLVQGLAKELKGEAACPDVREARDRAVLLDQFCAEVDVVIGLNVVSRDERPFPGTKIRALAESNGFKLEPDGAFRCHEGGDEAFALANYESQPFRSDTLIGLTTRGVTFLLDVPRVADGEGAFSRMVQLARTFSGTLGGVLVDDNRVPLNDGGLEKIREQIQLIQSRMKASGTAPGSRRALRLFS